MRGTQGPLKKWSESPNKCEKSGKKFLLFRKLSTWPVFGCLGPAPYWLIEAAFAPSTTTMSSKLIFLCRYTLKEQSLFIVFLETTWKLITFSPLSIKLLVGMECFHMTSRRPYWCPKTMKRRPCWCPKPVLWELNSFLMQTLSFVSINLHRCWSCE